MPPKKASIGRKLAKSKQTAGKRAAENDEERELRLRDLRNRASTSRAAETNEERESRLEDLRNRASTSRAAETNEEHESRLRELRNRATTSRATESAQQRDERLNDNRLRNNERRERFDLRLAAFNYDEAYDYKNHSDVTIGQMNVVCLHCNALKFQKESPGMCCSNGKVTLPPLTEPPEPILSYLSGTCPISKHVLQNIRKYNTCFQMTSFGATNIVNNAGYMPTFKAQGQIYHNIGSLLPSTGQDEKFLQIFFTGNEEKEVKLRRSISDGTRPHIILNLQTMFHEHNCLIRLFKSAIDQMPSDDYAVVIRADKTPSGEHERRFNAPVTGDIAVVMVGTEFNRRDIVIQRRDATLQRVSETHRSYDALQYPMLFPRGEDGYHFKIKQIDPRTNLETTKKDSCMDYYAYRIMIRSEEINYILTGRELFHQFIVDMYAKI